MAASIVRGGVVVLTVVVIAAMASACGTQPKPRTPSLVHVAAGLDDCGRGWSDARDGRQTFQVHNTTVAGEEVYLENVDTGAVYLDVENLGPDARLRSTVTLADGAYRFVCMAADEEPARGATVKVSGGRHVGGLTPGVVPVTRNQLLPVLKTYQAWIGSRLPVLQRQVDRLADDVGRGDLAAARVSWLTAHQTYETLGAAYGAFGDFDTRINGLPAPGTTALTDAHLEGFHRVEAMLWSGRRAAAVAPHTARLVRAVAGLRSAFGQARIDPVDIGLRAHEILENALQLELTGRTDAGSHTSLATIDANLTGTREALDPLRPVLQSRYPGLTKTQKALDDAQRLVRTYHHAGNRWTALSSLSRAQRERVDAQVSETLELLAPVAAITDPRKES